MVPAARVRGLGPTWKGGDGEGRLSCWAEGSCGSGGQPPGRRAALTRHSCLQGCHSSAGSSARGGFSYWLRYLNGMEDRL